jgi:hypothetical protein
MRSKTPMPQPFQTNQENFSDEGETLTKDERNGTTLPWAKSHDGTVNTLEEGSSSVVLLVLRVMHKAVVQAEGFITREIKSQDTIILNITRVPPLRGTNSGVGRHGCSNKGHRKDANFPGNRSGIARDLALECDMVTHLDDRKAKSMAECI